MSPSSLSPLLLLVASQFVLIVCRPNDERLPTPKDPNATESSEYVFSREVDYINKDHIAKLLKDDSRPAEIPPFVSEERLWNTPPARESAWKRAKMAVKKLFGLHKTTVKPAWNVTKERIGDYLIRKAKTFNNYVRYTLLKQSTPNITVEPSTEDPLNFWRAHYTNWKYFNHLHFEMLNSSIPENHWFFKTLMKEGYGYNVDDVHTTTPMPFDIHRMDGFSTNVTLAPTPDLESESEDSAQFDPKIREALTLRPAFENAINRYLSSFTVPLIPDVEINVHQTTNLANYQLLRRLQKKLASFYYITTRSPDEWMDTHERIKDKKLKKWLAKEEKRVHASIERHLDNYTLDFGPKFNSWYTHLLEQTLPDAQWDPELGPPPTMPEDKTEQDMLTTVGTAEKFTGTTRDEPQFVRDAFEQNRMVNVTVLEKWLYEHCSNNTIDWETLPPPTDPTYVSVDITDRPTPSEKQEITEPPPEIITIPKALIESNLTVDEAIIDRMYENAQKYMRNLSLLRIDENWHRISQAIYEAKHTTEKTINYDSVDKVFTEKLGNY